MRRAALRKTALIPAALLACLVAASPIRAEVVKQLQITSIPPGARVFLKKGTREIELGTTPFSYAFTFHSERSVLRTVFRKRGYDDKLHKVSAQDDEVVVNLAAFAVTVPPSKHKGPHLRRLQASVNPVIEKTLPRLLQKDGAFEFNLAAPVRVSQIDGQDYAILPIVLLNLYGEFKARGKARQLEMLRSVWADLGQDVVVPLARKLSGQGQLRGVVLNASFDEERFLFSVSSKVKASIDMKCVPGTVMKNVFDMCAKRRTEYYTDSSGNMHSRDAGCEGGYVMKSVYDPCARRMPVTKYETVVDPVVGATQGKASARYTLLMKQLSNESVPFEDVSIRLENAKGDTLYSQGQ